MLLHILTLPYYVEVKVDLPLAFKNQSLPINEDISNTKGANTSIRWCWS